MPTDQESDISDRLARHIELHHSRLRQAPVSTAVTSSEIRAHLQTHYDFRRPQPMDDLFDDVTDMLWRWAEHARNPMHFGLTRPTVDLPSIVADALVALYDPNLATWDFAPAANEIELFVLEVLAHHFGYEPEETCAHFTSGGQEANHTAVIVALAHSFPDIAEGGARCLDGQPVFYLSQEGHHSFEKVAHSAGLGRQALRLVPVAEDLKMKADHLIAMIEDDRCAGHLPFLVVGTAGTTGAGVIDPLADLADVAEQYGLWFHADAAWGGAAALSKRLRPLLHGIERTDSVTFDAHKWLSVPVGAGAFFCRHPAPVRASFGIETPYVPKQSDDRRVNPLTASMQWSRRCMGLKVFMMLAARGLPEIARRIEHQAELGHALADLLEERGWRVVNQPDLAVVCFTHPAIEQGRIAAPEIVRQLKEKQIAWISYVVLRSEIGALRASVTNYETRRGDIEHLVDALERTVHVKDEVEDSNQKRNRLREPARGGPTRSSRGPLG